MSRSRNTLSHPDFAKVNSFASQLNSELAHSKAQTLTRQRLASYGRGLAPALLALAFSTSAHAQGTMDFSGASTLMTTFKNFAMIAGAVICLCGLIFAGIRMMGGRWAESIGGLAGALFGAGVLGWGAGWIGSLTGQTIQ